MITLQGQFGKPRTVGGIKENVFQILARMTNEKWGINIPENDFGQYHYLGKGVIVEFLKRTPNSAFQQILSQKNDTNPHVRLSAQLKLCEKDMQFEREARSLVDLKKMDSCFVDSVSGKVTLKKNGKFFPIKKASDLDKWK